MSLPARDRARLAACSSRSDGSQRRLATLVAAAILALPLASASVLAQSSAIDDQTLADRPIAKVTFQGLSRVSEREVLNNIRVATGQPFESAAVRQDVATLYRLGQFDTVDAIATVGPS